MKINYAPILLFTYNRLTPLKKTVKALQQNFDADKSQLYIFSDAAKHEKDISIVNEVRKYVKTIKGFRTTEIVEAAVNKGLATSIITGVSEILAIHHTAIVLEDDLVSSNNFLSFMNQALQHYSGNEKILSIAGFSMPVKNLQPHETYVTKRASSWGWATWKESWEKVDWQVADYDDFSKDISARFLFNKMGSDMSSMLDRQMNGKINSWAIRWCYHQFKNNLYTVYPAVSKICNIGIEDPEATHTHERFSRFKTTLDTSGNENFDFTDDIQLKPEIIKQFVKPYSIPERVKYKLLNTLAKF